MRRFERQQGRFRAAPATGRLRAATTVVHARCTVLDFLMFARRPELHCAVPSVVFSLKNRGIACAVSALLMVPAPLPAVAAGPPSEVDPTAAALDAAHLEAQTLYDAGKFLPAARTWTASVENVPESEAFRAQRASIYEYIADAYLRAEPNGVKEDVIREALAVFDRYASQLSEAYGPTPLPEKVRELRDRYRIMVDAYDARREAEDAARLRLPPPAPTPASQPPAIRPPVKPWKGLAVAGGVTLGTGAGMFAMFVASAARADALERRVEDPAKGCFRPPEGPCAGLDEQGRTANSLAVAGLVVGPLLAGVGAALLAVAARRRSVARGAPVLGRTGHSLVFSVSF
ncbi:hypothetical protein [Nannocystis pusilla]|uniref:Uncharacterized protein n=1 Tax=Nannocystis pusilla TaxID=889268 RepID=A0ABS7U5V6_9BACT|nr:hypothetical protein [Nannocystis pusilla]MBZ5715794.1 hypothetical protein [Nannocystis pusilla]